MIENKMLPDWVIPVLYKVLYKYQQKDKDLKKQYLQNSKDYTIRSFSTDASTV